MFIFVKTGDNLVTTDIDSRLEFRDLFLNLPTDNAQIGPRYWKSIPSLVSSSPNLYSEPALWIRNEVWLPGSLAFELPQVSLLDSSNRVLQHFTVMVSCFLVGYLLRLSLNLVRLLGNFFQGEGMLRSRP